MYKLFSTDCPDIVTRLAQTAPMQRLAGVSMHCGVEYTSFPSYRDLPPYSRLTHSIGVGCIVWHFTHDEAQAAAGLLHDIATPSFAHVIDFLHGDHVHQESTEALTRQIIDTAPDIQAILTDFDLCTDQVANYHCYPVADNDSPRLSADRLEYTLGYAHFAQHLPLTEVAALYRDLTLSTGEDGQPELAFIHQAAAEGFARLSLANGRWYVMDEDRFSMQALADLMRYAMGLGVMEEYDLYRRESDVIAKFLADERTASAWRAYRAMATLAVHDQRPQDRYAVNIPSKKRYIDPLVAGPRGARRISAQSPSLAKQIKAFLGMSFDRWLTLA